MLEPHDAAVTPGCELEPREGIDRHRVRRDPMDVAERDLRASGREQRADARAEPREVVSPDGAPDRERNAPRLGRPHPRLDGAGGRGSSVGAADEFRRRPSSNARHERGRTERTLR